MATLSPNAISTMLDMERRQDRAALIAFCPTVQVIEIKTVPGKNGGQSRVKLSISDGNQFMFCIIRSQSNPEISVFDVIQLKEPMMQPVQNKKQPEGINSLICLAASFVLLQHTPSIIGAPTRANDLPSPQGMENHAPPPQQQQPGPYGHPPQNAYQQPMQPHAAAPGTYGAPAASTASSNSPGRAHQQGAYGQPGTYAASNAAPGNLQQQPQPNGMYGAPPAGAYGQPHQQQQQATAAVTPNGAPPAGTYDHPQQQQFGGGSGYGAPPAGAYGQPAQHQAAAGGYGAPPAGAYGQPQAARGALPSSLNALQPNYRASGPTARNTGAPAFTRIQDVSPYLGRWTIRGRCTTKSELRSYNRNGKQGHVFNFDLLDESGEVRCVAFGDVAQGVYDKVIQDRFYTLTKATAKPIDSNKRKWNQTGHACEITLERNSELTEAEDEGSVPRINLKPVKLSDVEAAEVNSFVDVIAVLDSCQDLSKITRRDGSESEKRSLVVRDDSARSIELTLWGEKAREVGAELFERARQDDHPVLVIKGARVGEFNGKNLGSVSSTTLLVDAMDVPGVPEMLQWYQSGGSAQQAQALSRVGGGRADRRVTVQVIKDELLGSGGNTAWVKVVGTIGSLRAERMTYPACRLDFNGRPCHKKLQQDSLDESGQMFCERCSATCEPEYRYLLNFSVLDFTANLENVSGFGEAGNSLMGMTATEAHHNLEGEDKGEAHDAWVSDRVLNRHWVLKLKCSEDTYNNETRVKYTLQSCEMLDYSSESTLLISMIDDLEHNRPVKAMQPPPPKPGFGMPMGGTQAFGGVQSPGGYGGLGAGMGGIPGGGFMQQQPQMAMGAGGFMQQGGGNWMQNQAGPQGGMQYGGSQQNVPFNAPGGMVQGQYMQQPMMQQQQPNMAFIDQPQYQR